VTFHEALQLRAAAAVYRPDEEAWHRHVLRWYSKTFATPLTEVYELPIDFVLTHYFEGVLEAMDEETRHETCSEWVMTPEERKALRTDEEKAEEADAEFFEKLEAGVEKGEAKVPKERPKWKPPNRKGPPPVLKEATLPESPELPPPPGPDFRTDFSLLGGGNLLDEVGSLDPLAPRPSKKVI
jgi:hypothetical protein